MSTRANLTSLFVLLALFHGLICELRSVQGQTSTSVQGQTSRTAKLANNEDGFTQLFDGKSFDGWEGNLDYFRIEAGAIVAGNLEEKIPNNEFLCTKEKYSDFELRLDAKLIGQGDNAGVQFRSERIPNHHEVIGYQCDIGLMGADRSIWGSLYDESRRKKFLAESPADSLKLIHQGQWNQLRIVAQGPKIKLYVNDQLMSDYVEKESDIASNGIIGLQIHSGAPAEAWYRNIRLKNLAK